ncbi:restriction endonuclease subunit S [Xanthomonas massiliensis]|uniref:restriction endonuclease subunit S n=1 Tax=Xanthomonas massiliensis TaxID=1720302 RepID=UPI00098EEE70|nr:restriction endonuclease subunit S [Xanthomonas massiliensis]
MSLPRYPEYKDSGVTWLGSVPAHWRIYRLQDVATIINGYPFDSKLFDAEGEFPLVRIRDLNRNEAETRYAGEQVGAAIVSSRDVLIGMDGDFNVGRWLGSEPALLNQRMCCVRTRDTGLSSILLHALPIPLRAINDVTYSTTVKHLSSSDVEKIRLALPIESTEVQAIAAFLDRETAKIDALIAEQEKLLALLAEKRQATISRAVTRGLDPNVPMKDSGIPWLGHVPAHWVVSKLKRVTQTIEQGWSPQCENYPVEDSTEWGVLKVGCVNRGVFDPDQNKRLPSELAPRPEYALNAGDLLISRANTRELVGSAAVVPSDLDHLLLCDKLYRLRLDRKECLPEYAAFVLGTREARSQIELVATGASSSMLNIGQDVVMELPLPLPTVAEQQQVVYFIQTKLNKLNSLSSSAQRTIDLLKERRSALIAAAVTGKIDVRGAVEGMAA